MENKKRQKCICGLKIRGTVASHNAGTHHQQRMRALAQGLKK